MMKKIIKQLIKEIHKIKLKNNKKVRICKKVNYTFNSVFEGSNVINEYTSIDNSTIGYGTYIGFNCSFTNTKIGKYCSIASDVKTIVGTHPTNTFVSTHPAFFSLRKQAGFTYVNVQKFDEIKYIDEAKKISIEIGNDVWIGQGVTIMAGVKIGDGCIVGANSVVTKDLPDYSICVGVPAKVIKYRFDDSDIKFLQEFKWWDKSNEWISKNANVFEDINELKEKYHG